MKGYFGHSRIALVGFSSNTLDVGVSRSPRPTPFLVLMLTARLVMASSLASISSTVVCVIFDIHQGLLVSLVFLSEFLFTKIE